MTTKRLIEARDLSRADIVFGDMTSHVSRNSDVSYQRIPITYNNGPLILKIPPCQSFGIHSSEMDNGNTRRTMPLVFNNIPTKQQEEFGKAFYEIKQCVWQHLVNRGFSISRLEKLGSCFWKEKILYAGIVESVYDSSLNSRYFIDNKEVGRALVGESSEYDTVAAIVVDSIYVGEKTISIQVKLYEVSLTPSKKRDRVL